MWADKYELLLPAGNVCFDGAATADQCCRKDMRDSLACWPALIANQYDACCNAENLQKAVEVDRRWGQLAGLRLDYSGDAMDAEPLLECLSPGDVRHRSAIRMFLSQNAPQYAFDQVETQSDVDRRLKYRWGHAPPRARCGRDAKNENTDNVVIEIFKQLSSALGESKMTHWLVNLGAGFASDPMYALARYNFSGVLVDPMGPPPELDLDRRFRFVRGAADPENLFSIFRRGGLSCPRPGYAKAVPIDFLKVDVDSCDCVLTAAALRLVRPKVVWMEINFGIPPPIRFARQCHADWRRLWHRWMYGGRTLATFGCSLSEAVMVLGRFGYSLYRLAGGVDAIFVRDGQVASALGGAGIDEIACYNEGLDDSYIGLIHWTWIDEWRRSRPQLALNTIWCNLTLHDFLLGVSHIPFSLAI